MEISKSDSGFVELRLPKFDFPVRILLAPYDNEVSLRTYLGEENREEAFRELLGQNWQILADRYCDEKGVNLFMGHFFFVEEGSTTPPDAEPESERPILHVGGTQSLFTQQLPSQIQYAALGHLHRYQTVSKLPGPVVYSSSPLAYSFSEADQEKNVVLIQAKPNEPVQYHPIPLKQGRPLYKVSFDNLPDTLAWLEAHPSCFVEITYLTDESIDANTRKAILKAHDGIVNLIPQLRQTSGQAQDELRAEDLSRDMESLFRLFYTSEKGQEPNAQLVELFKEVLSKTTAS
jgi:exonuclease SbcD